MTINLHLPTPPETLRPTITVVGVGGAGGNAVNNMISSELEGVNFVVANTDAQALEHSLTERRILLGTAATRGLGAGGKPEMGRIAAEESADELLGNIEGSNMVFITAGMGGGTGTGAAPVVARLAKELGILTVAVVTKPFSFEGPVRMRQADAGLDELHRFVDTVIVIPNQNLFRVANEKTTFADAFRMADEVLHSGVRGVTDLITMPGLINLDFADIRTVMQEMGKAIMGTGEAIGERRAIEAAEAAISNPLLDDVSMKGARGVLINITGGHDMTLFEVDEAANRIRSEVDPDANIIFGSTFNPSMDGRMRVSVVATGIEGAATAASNNAANAAAAKPVAVSPANRFGPRPSEARPVDAPRAAVFDFRNNPAPDAARVAPKARPAAMVSEVAMVEEQNYAEAAPAMEAPQAVMPLEAPVTRAPMAQPAPVNMRPAQASYAEAAPEPVRYSESQESISPRMNTHNEMRSAPVAAPAPAAKQSGGLFDRLSHFGRALGGRGEAEIEHEAPRPRDQQRKAEVRSSAATAQAAEESVDEDYIDIPAFLRRQAN